MNRQEKRRLKKESVKKSDLQKIRDTDLVVRFLAVCMQVLHDDFGFGATRIKRFGERVEDSLDCIGADYVSFGDILDNLSIKEK